MNGSSSVFQLGQNRKRCTLLSLPGSLLALPGAPLAPPCALLCVLVGPIWCVWSSIAVKHLLAQRISLFVQSINTCGGFCLIKKFIYTGIKLQLIITVNYQYTLKLHVHVLWLCDSNIVTFSQFQNLFSLKCALPCPLCTKCPTWCPTLFIFWLEHCSKWL